MSKLFYYDLETTGVKYWKNGIHQISGAIEIDGNVIETFDFHVKPNEKATIEPDALAVANVTVEDLANYTPMAEIYKTLTSMLGKYVKKFDKKDKFHLIGYNNRSFDDQFLRAFFTQSGDMYFGSWYWADSIDVLVLASHCLQNERANLENFQLRTVAKYLGIEVDESKLHNALYDIELTRKIYHILIHKYLRNV